MRLVRDRVGLYGNRVTSLRPRFHVATAFVCLLLAARLTAAEIPQGRILEKVACVADPAQTYALYVPTTFEPTKRWPVLFCFDPGAHGHAPVERFQAAAEKFGWLVAGSNNSRNGPWDNNVAAIMAMVTDVDRHLPIDPRRIYVAGLSGGARVACQVAEGGLPAGVIACSAGFGGEIPSKVPFAFFGTAGTTDFNYRELRRVDRELDDRKAVHRVIIFDGGHEWLPSALTFEALAWLNLQAMRRGSLPPDSAWIAEQFAARLAAVPAEPAVENYRALKATVADFKGVADTAEWERKVAALGATHEVREMLKAERAAERTEDALTENLMTAASEGPASSVRKLLADLQAKQRPGASPSDRAMADRVLHGVASACGEQAREAMRANEFERAATLLEASVLLRPDRLQAYVELARARAALGDKKRAIAALEQAVAAGYRDAARLENEKAFEKLRREPAYAALIERIKMAEK